MSNFANTGKNALNSIELEDEFGPSTNTSGYEQIVTHYSLTTPKVPKPNVSQFVAGDAVIGEYAGNYIEPMYGKVKHRVRTDKGLVTIPGSLPGTGQLNKALERLAVKDGDRLRIVYQGMSEVTKGKAAGKPAHGFAVTLSRLNKQAD